MLRTVTTALLATAAIGFAGSAMAAQIDNQNYGVDVNIEVLPIVSLWGFEDTIALAFEGANAVNGSYHNSQFSYINNTPASIQVTVSGDFGADADDVNFYVADEGNGATVLASMLGPNAYNPVGVGTVLRWDFSSNNTTQTFKGNIPVAQNGAVETFSYLINAPGGSAGLAGDTYALDVTWTISDVP